MSFFSTNELIKKEDAIEAAISAVDNWACNTDDDTPPISFERDALIEKFIDELPPAQPEPHWIPCEEEMPKEKDAGVLQKIGIKKKSDNVLVTIDINNIKGVEVACTWDGMWRWEGMFAFPKWEVIAWMQFPAPYKEEPQEE